MRRSLATSTSVFLLTGASFDDEFMRFRQSLPKAEVVGLTAEDEKQLQEWEGKMDKEAISDEFRHLDMNACHVLDTGPCERTAKRAMYCTGILIMATRPCYCVFPTLLGFSCHVRNHAWSVRATCVAASNESP